MDTRKFSKGTKTYSDKNNYRKLLKPLLIIGCVLAAALIVCIVILIMNTEQNNRIMNSESALSGVSVNGIDISGMSKDRALSATNNSPDEILGKTVISVDVNGDITKINAKDLGFSTDYDTVINDALSYGHTGTLEERKQAISNAKENGVRFSVKPVVDKETLMSALLPLKEKYDKQSVDASVLFMPRGYLSDGTKYEPDEQALIKACAKDEPIELPANLVRIPAEEKPNEYRYELYKENKFVKDYIPAQADVSRFLYTADESGQSLSVDALADSILARIQSGDYSTPIKATIDIIESTVKLKDIKQSTQLIASWTSSYASHNGYNRNWNLSKLSGIINGIVIQPGEEWSINKQAGNRTSRAGWLDAPGIENGGYIDQPGGGVCQISSTLYNAAIRANLDISDSTHHSIISPYIPIGLDATISSGAPDLKIRNNQSTPIYIVSYTNPKDKNVTVEIYGQTVVDPQYGDVILTFTSEDLGAYGNEPIMNYVYNATVSYDGTPIPLGESIVYAESRPGRKAQTYKHILSLDGTELKVENFTSFAWRAINGTTYVNGPDPATVTPTPTVSSEPSPMPSEPSVTNSP